MFKSATTIKGRNLSFFTFKKLFDVKYFKYMFYNPIGTLKTEKYSNQKMY